ncbi:MAG: hypothetical protein J5871_05210 [Bacteroidales bacterium]|nr:hypothetical protein [Bacteroidales bacterium]
MKRNAKILLTALLLGFSLVAAAADGLPPVQMGGTFGRDSSKCSGRSFPKRLFMPKGSLGAGLQATYLALDASDSQLAMVLTGADARFSLFRIAPAFSWAYADNRMFGVRLGYMSVNAQVQRAGVSLFDDALAFDLSGVDTRLHTCSAGIYHRNYFGLDSRGVCALFADIQLGYAYSQTAQGGYRDHKIVLSFCPGVEVFAMNNLSLQLSLGLADVSYHIATSLTDAGTAGRSNTFTAQTRLNLLDLNFGLTLYW